MVPVNDFYVLDARRMKRIMIIVVAVLFSVAVVYVEKDNVSVFSHSEPSAIYSVVTDQKVIALTFDISWGDRRAEPILEVLKEKDVKDATFFLSSPWTKTHPQIVKKIVDGGFEIGSHGHKHDNYNRLDEEDIRAQIRTAHTILTEETGKAPNLIRLPNGAFDKRVLRIADELGYTVIQWDTDSLDWKNPGAEQIVKRVVSRAHPGDIVLLHASDSSQQTHLALPVIIDQLRAKGYRFVSVSELLQLTEQRGKVVPDQR
jgi:polysaccharide deacetylase family sporulation protein PdaB